MAKAKLETVVLRIIVIGVLAVIAAFALAYFAIPRTMM